VYHLSAGCQIEIGEGGLTGSTTCVLDREVDGSVLPDSRTVRVAWATESVQDLIGESLLVTWRLGGGLRSEGQAIVAVDESSTPDPGLLILPEVPLEATTPTAVLRLRILGYTGDGTYTGSAVDPAIDVTLDSPLIVNGPPPDLGSEPWGAILGPCRATVSEEGRSGSMSCPGDPTFPADNPRAGSVTLFATWRFLY
jgi:hypothetical protein